MPVRHVHAHPSHSSHTCTHTHLTYVTLTATDSNTKHVLIRSETLRPILVHAHSGPTSDPEERQSQGDLNTDAEAARNREGQRDTKK